MLEDETISYIQEMHEEKKLMVEDIDSKIESLQKTIDEVVIDNINVEKEYKVWIHQNEKLENILH